MAYHRSTFAKLNCILGCQNFRLSVGLPLAFMDTEVKTKTSLKFEGYEGELVIYMQQF